LRLSFTSGTLKTPAFGRSERRDNEHMGRRRFGRVSIGAQQVLAVGRAERPGEFDLGEAEQPARVASFGCYRLIAY
jgi:hypothetical protein